MKAKLTELKTLTRRAVLKYGYDEKEAEAICEVLLYAQLRGNNQGVVKLIGAGIPRDTEAKPIEILKESKATAHLDAHQTHAMVAIRHATDLAIQKAKEAGVGVIGVRGINTSSGALGYYARRIANAGLAGIVCSGSMETVAPDGSSQAMLGTNPLAIAVPNDGEPLVYDITTSAMAYFGVVEANTAGKDLPEGIAYDKNGNPTKNPAEVMDDGALKSFDGSHKGSGLSIMVQALTGPLMGAYFTGVGDVAKNWGGHFVLAIDPEMFVGREELKKNVRAMIEKIKASRPLAGREVLVPGERGDARTKEAESTGEIEIEDNLYEGLKTAAS